MRAADVTGVELAKKLSDLAGREISDKTVWNWVNKRYQFRVVVECADGDLSDIKGVYKETKIL